MSTSCSKSWIAKNYITPQVPDDWTQSHGERGRCIACHPLATCLFDTVAIRYMYVSHFRMWTCGWLNMSCLKFPHIVAGNRRYRKCVLATHGCHCGVYKTSFKWGLWVWGGILLQHFYLAPFPSYYRLFRTLIEGHSHMTMSTWGAICQFWGYKIWSLYRFSRLKDILRRLKI